MQRKMLALWQQQLNGFHFVCSPARCKTLETREPFFAACIGRARGADVRIFHIPKSLICYAFLPCHSRHTRSCQSFELVIISSSSGAFFPFFFFFAPKRKSVTLSWKLWRRVERVSDSSRSFSSGLDLGLSLHLHLPHLPSAHMCAGAIRRQRN